MDLPSNPCVIPAKAGIQLFCKSWKEKKLDPIDEVAASPGRG